MHVFIPCNSLNGFCLLPRSCDTFGLHYSVGRLLELLEDYSVGRLLGWKIASSPHTAQKRWDSQFATAIQSMLSKSLSHFHQWNRYTSSSVGDHDTKHIPPSSGRARVLWCGGRPSEARGLAEHRVPPQPARPPQQAPGPAHAVTAR